MTNSSVNGKNYYCAILGKGKTQNKISNSYTGKEQGRAYITVIKRLLYSGTIRALLLQLKLQSKMEGSLRAHFWGYSNSNTAGLLKKGIQNLMDIGSIWINPIHG